MSNTSYLSTPNSYNLSAGNSDVPPSLSSSPYPRPVSCVKQIVSIASTSADQQAGGLVSFAIPTGMGSGAYLVNNSVYLNCRITLNTSANYTSGNDTGFALPSQSASAIINRLTLSIGSQQVCQINQYHLLHEILLTHTTNRNYYIDDSCILQYTTNSKTFLSGTTAGYNSPYVDVVIPLICPLWQERSVPLFLLNAPILLQLDLNTKDNALYGATATDTALGFKVSNAQLVYETLQMSPEYVNEIKMAMSKGLLYQINMTDYMTLTTASSAYLNYLIGCNLSSVKGVIYTQVTNSPASNVVTTLASNTQTNFRLYLDGRQINNFNLSSDAQIFCEFQRCLGNMFDSNITSYIGTDAQAGNTSRPFYRSSYFAGGVSCSRINDNGYCMTGSPCQSINFVLESAGGSKNVYIVVVYEDILTIDVNGNVQLIK
jgi:hypothetical protein